MEGYLGEEIIKMEESEFKNYTPSDWALYFISAYGLIDGSHHKQWVLDQVARILKGTEIVIKQASWSDGTKEYRVSTGKESEAYRNWIEKCYNYDMGIAP